MTDPLEALRTPITAVDPDPEFAARLRERVRRALLAPTGGTMTITAESTIGAAPAVARMHALTPYICVDDARRALDWYAEALGARRRGEPIVMDDDRIGHAELAFGDSVMMFADEFPEIGMLGPRARGGVSFSLNLQVSDVDATVGRAVALGAELTRPVADYPYGRNGVISDPFGHRWIITSPPPPPAPRNGDVAYCSLWVPDVERAAGFYQTVLGWRYAPDHQVQGLGQHIGMSGGHEHRTLFLCFAVRDVREVVRRVRDAGGHAEEPTQEPYGLTSMCADDQGLAFAVYEEPAAQDGPAEEGAGPGEIAHITIEVPDSARARAFYGRVLGWEYEQDGTPDGWTALIGHNPSKIGLHGGRPAPPTVVPTFLADDIEVAVRRVRAAGGTAAAPRGRITECADDQGTRFHLTQP